MKVAINISPLKTAHKTRGIGIYTRRLVAAVRAVDKKNRYILTTKSLQIKNLDLIHYPYFDLFFNTLPLKKRAKTVVTIHDLIPLVYPNHFRPGIKGKIRFALQKMALQNVDAVLTDSENSKQDIIRFLSLPSEKIYVIQLAAGREFKPATENKISSIKKRYRLPDKFLLYVGDVNYNKNLPNLITAFSQIYHSFPDLHLLLVGKAFANKKLQEIRKLEEKIEALDLGKRVSLNSEVPLDPGSDLAAIYSAALVYVQPSIYEGFGLPVVEAFSCATPVIAGNNSSLPEISGGAALLVDTANVDRLAAGITQLLKQSKKQRKIMIQKGLLQAKKFSWRKTAGKTIAVYQSLICNEK